MSRRRWEQDRQDFSHRRCCSKGSGNGVFPLISLVLGVATLLMTVVFRVVEIFLSAFLGVLQKKDRPQERPVQNTNSKQHTSTAKEEFAAERSTVFRHPAAEPVKNQSSAETDERKPSAETKEEGKQTAKQEPAKESGEKKEESTRGHRRKDWYVTVFILTMIPCIVALAIGKLVYAGMIALAGLGLLILSALIIGMSDRLRKKSEEAPKPVEEEKTDDVVEQLIKEAFEKLFEIRKALDQVQNPDIRCKIDGICCIGEKIIGEVRTHPENLKPVKKFFYYYLDAFGEIVRKYLRLSSFTEASEDVQTLLSETEKSFSDIESIFKELCEKLVEKDMMDLKAEINVIKNSN